MNKIMTAALAALVAYPLLAVQGTIRTETDRKTGEIKWRSRDKTYVMSIKKGQTLVDMEYKLSDVVGLDVEKPAGFDKAVEMVQKGQGASAIGTLAKIVEEYKMFVWDKPAGRWLVEAYLAADNAQKALDVATSIISEDKDAAWQGDLAPAYWQVLLRLGKSQQLEKCISKAASSGDRVSSAQALLMRGDILVAGGDSRDLLRQALSDAYLRVALMYRDEPCREVRAQAMMKAAACFDKLGDATRAENLRSQAKSI